MNFSKSLVAVIASAVVLYACGNNSDKPATKDSAATTTAPAADNKGVELIAASDCPTCHKLHKDGTGGGVIGPAYDDVAAKYSPAADSTIDRLVKKVISGGSGIWGTVPMTPHQALKPEDVKTMVTYILTLKKS